MINLHILILIFLHIWLGLLVAPLLFQMQLMLFGGSRSFLSHASDLVWMVLLGSLEAYYSNMTCVVEVE